jgi:ribosomal protein S14
MKKNWIHLLHSYEPKSEFAGSLKIESRFGRGESTYCQNCGRDHGTKFELFRGAFRCFGLLLYKVKTRLQKS